MRAANQDTMRLSPRRRWIGAAAAATVCGAALLTPALASSGSSPVPPIGHVFVIVLENKGYGSTFANPPTQDPYLAKTLVGHGALLTRYYGTGHESNDNYLSMISGQAPNPQTQFDCQSFTDFTGPGLTVSPGQAVGSGCVYPTSVKTVADQLTAAGKTWKGYMQDMGNVTAREPAVCAHPAINAQDKTQSAAAGDGYATRHNPFVYFHTIIDSASECASHVVPLGDPSGALPASAPPNTTGLATDLVTSTPNLSFIVPNLCMDGHDYPCTNQTAPTASALGDIDSFLKTWVPKIEGSPAFKKDGLLAIVFDESDGPQSDSTACCDEQPGPNSAMPGINGPGGGRTGAVLLSPFIAPGTVTTIGYNHYSLLASIEQMFKLSRLGEAQTVPATFGRDVYR